MTKYTGPRFANEAELCAAFIAEVPKTWTAYPETANFDILLVRNDGAQVGVEAKLTLNMKVISQAAARNPYYAITDPQPDFRAVLIPSYATTEGAAICRLLGITVLTMRHPGHTWTWWHYHKLNFDPALPGGDEFSEQWWDHWPAKRCPVPDYVPDVAAGASGPIKLSHWKIRAIKIAVLLDKRGGVTRQDFKSLGIDATRWIGRSGWLDKGDAGKWVRGEYTPDFRAQHPSVYEQIEADFEKWAPSEKPPFHQEALL